MRNPIKGIRTALRVGSAMRRASRITADPEYVEPSRFQKMIEYSAMVYLDPDARAEALLEILKNAVEAEETEAAKEGLRLLTKHYSSSTEHADRLGGVPGTLHPMMQEYNARISEVFPDDLVDTVASLSAEQDGFDDETRLQNKREAMRTMHRRYPADFKSEIYSYDRNERDAAIRALDV